MATHPISAAGEFVLTMDSGVAARAPATEDTATSPEVRVALTVTTEADIALEGALPVGFTLTAGQLQMANLVALAAQLPVAFTLTGDVLPEPPPAPPAPAAYAASAASVVVGSGATLDLPAMGVVAGDVVVVWAVWLPATPGPAQLIGLDATAWTQLGFAAGDPSITTWVRIADGTEGIIGVTLADVDGLPVVGSVALVGARLTSATTVGADGAVTDAATEATATPTTSPVVFDQDGVALALLAMPQAAAETGPAGWTARQSQSNGGALRVQLHTIDAAAGALGAAPYATASDGEWSTSTVAIDGLATAVATAVADWVSAGAAATAPGPAIVPPPPDRDYNLPLAEPPYPKPLDAPGVPYRRRAGEPYQP